MVSEQVNPENRVGISVNALYGQRICRLATCKKPFKPARKDQVFCDSAHRKKYYDAIFIEGKKVVLKKERQERFKGVRAVTQDMTPKERLAALVETAQAVLGGQLRNTPATRPAPLLVQSRENKC